MIGLFRARPARTVAEGIVMAEVEFAYEPPEISEEGDIATWRWHVVNNLAEAAHKVVLTHRLTPWLPIKSVTDPSEVEGEAVKTRWETLAAGERAEGEITAGLPEEMDGTVQIAGRIVWQTA